MKKKAKREELVALSLKWPQAEFLRVDRLAERTGWSWSRVLRLMAECSDAALAGNAEGVRECGKRVEAAALVNGAKLKAEAQLRAARAEGRRMLGVKAKPGEAEHRF